MATPIFERLNGARIESDPKRSGGSRPTERAKEPGQQSGAQLNRTDFGVLKSRIQRRIISELAPEADLGGVPGRRAIEELLNILPKGKLIAWLFKIPYIRPLVELFYRWFARNRYKLGCGEHCSLRPRR